MSITNTGNTAFTPIIIATNVPSGWTFHTSTLTSISPTQTFPIEMTLVWTGTGSAPVGNIGTFTVTIKTA
jgi:uncharacterized membrane protein